MRPRPPLALALGVLLVVPLLGGTHPPGRAPDASPRAAQAAVLADPPIRRASEVPRVKTRPKDAPGRAGELRVVPVKSTRPVPAGVVRYAVEVEGGLRVDRRRFAAFVEQALDDPRGWSGATRQEFRRVESDADLRVALASPRLTDQLCLPLLTNGIFSCAAANRAVLNIMRWRRGAESYAGQSLGLYRLYMVNHEVGHLLGHGHASCTAPGQRAPLMMQQTKGTDGCRPNPWPLASERY